MTLGAEGGEESTPMTKMTKMRHRPHNFLQCKAPPMEQERPAHDTRTRRDLAWRSHPENHHKIPFSQCCPAKQMQAASHFEGYTTQFRNPPSRSKWRSGARRTTAAAQASSEASSLSEFFMSSSELQRIPQCRSSSPGPSAPVLSGGCPGTL